MNLYVSENAAYRELKEQLKLDFSVQLTRYKLFSENEFVYCSIMHDENRGVFKDYITIFLNHNSINIKVQLPKYILEAGGIIAARDYVGEKIEEIFQKKVKKEPVFTECDSTVAKQLMKEIVEKDLLNPFYCDLPKTDISGATPQTKKNNKNNKKEKNMSKKLYDVEYENEVAAINEKAKSEKKALDAKAEEDIAKAEAEHEKAKIREDAANWAFGVKAMYNALLEEGFTDDLAVKFIEIQLKK